MYDLNNVSFEIDKNIIKKYKYPFYNEHLIFFYLKPLQNNTYIPIHVKDPEIIEQYNVNNLNKLIKNTISDTQIFLSNTININYKLFLLDNNWYCLKFEKIYIWDDFHSTFTIFIFSQNKDCILNFYNLEFEK